MPSVVTSTTPFFDGRSRFYFFVLDFNETVADDPVTLKIKVNIQFQNLISFKLLILFWCDIFKK